MSEGAGRGEGVTYEVGAPSQLSISHQVRRPSSSPPPVGTCCRGCVTSRCSCSWSLVKCLALGQILSILICVTAITSQELHSQYYIFVPTAQSFLNYVMLCMVYTTMLACRSGDKGLLAILRKRGWKYLLIAIADVEANYLVVKAYHYTTLTSVQLLDCFTIAVVLLLSFLFLKVRYGALHVISVGICLIGVGCLVWADVLVKKKQGDSSNKLLGDMLCLAGAALYGVSNVAEEYVVKTYNRVEFLGMLGLFGSVVNGIQLSALERHEVASIPWSSYPVVLLLVGYAVALFLLYSIMPVVMKATSATAANLAILSADFYTLLLGLLLFHLKFHILYFVSFTLIILGIIIYSIKPVGVRVLNADGGQNYRPMEEDGGQCAPGIADVELHNHMLEDGVVSGQRAPWGPGEPAQAPS